MLRLIIVLHVVGSIEFVEDKNLLIHRTLGADRTAYSLSIRIYGDSSQLSFFVSSFRERLIVLATFSERTKYLTAVRIRPECQVGNLPHSPTGPRFIKNEQPRENFSEFIATRENFSIVVD